MRGPADIDRVVIIIAITQAVKRLWVAVTGREPGDLSILIALTVSVVVNVLYDLALGMMVSTTTLWYALIDWLLSIGAYSVAVNLLRSRK